MLSRIIQHNFDKRRGLSVFQSKSARPSFVRRAQAPPPGIYEHKFVSGLKKKKKVDGKAQSVHLIDHPYRAEPS